jgi:Fe-Mn family superoxide dismutase
VSCFGSGYVWLLVEGDGSSRVVTTGNADNPLYWAARPVPVLRRLGACVHLDHRNARGTFLETFLDRLVSWDRLSAALQRAA